MVTPIYLHDNPPRRGKTSVPRPVSLRRDHGRPLRRRHRRGVPRRWLFAHKIARHGGGHPG